MRNRSVNNYGVVWIFRKKLFLKRKSALTAACTTPPGKDRILDISL